MQAVGRKVQAAGSGAQERFCSKRGTQVEQGQEAGASIVQRNGNQRQEECCSQV